MQVQIPRGELIVRHGTYEPLYLQMASRAARAEGPIKRSMFHPGFLNAIGEACHLQLSIMNFTASVTYSSRAYAVETVLQSLDPALVGTFEEQTLSLQGFLAAVPGDGGIIVVSLVTRPDYRPCRGVAPKYLCSGVDVEIAWMDISALHPKMKELKLAANLVATPISGYFSHDKAAKRIVSGRFLPMYLHPQTSELQKAGEEWLVGERGMWDEILTRVQK